VEPPSRARRRDPRPADRDAGEQALEGQARGMADRLRSSRRGDVQVTEGALPTSIRAPVEQWAGTDLSDVQLRRGGLAADRPVRAATDGATIFVPPAAEQVPAEVAEQVMTHELVHLAQQRAGERGPALPARTGRPQFDWCWPDPSAPKAPTALDKIRAGGTITAAEAGQALDEYAAMSPLDRNSAVGSLHRLAPTSSKVGKLLEALPEQERVKRMDLIRDFLDRLQAMSTQVASGMTEDQLAKTQGAWMEKQAQAAALAEAEAEAKKKGAPPPTTVTPAEVNKAHTKEVAKQALPPSPGNRWTSLDAKAQTDWNARASKAIAAVVSTAAKKASHLKISPADIKWDPVRIEGYPSRIYALSGRPYIVGMSFIEAAEADPEYVLGSVLHEIFGHPEYGDLDSSYERKIYDKATTSYFPSYAKPADQQNERLSYGYIGTEIYAEMREFEYAKPILPAHAQKGISGGDEPAANIDELVLKLRTLYEPTVARALLTGMWERFRIDPRLVPGALALFVASAEKYFPKVLKK